MCSALKFSNAIEICREGAIIFIFRDLGGKLDVLNVECENCGRRGRYPPDRLIERYEIDAKPFDRSDEITADCPGCWLGSAM